MTDLLIFEESLASIAGVLKDFPQLRVVCWQAGGHLTIDGQPVAANDVTPEIGWISFNLLASGQMKSYVDTLLRFHSLCWVQSTHAGLDNPAYRQLAQKGVRLSKSYAQSIPIAEYVLAHALYHFQGIEFRLEAQRAADWKGFRFRELYGTRWLIVGFGHIGRRVAERARAFNCHITTLRRSGTSDAAADEIVSREGLLHVLGQSDVVVLACPENQETRGIVDTKFVRAMKVGSLLVNVARGGLIDDQALLEGLAAGRPGSAVLDTFNDEPLPGDHPYWSHPGVVVTAHTSNAGEGTAGRSCQQFIGNLERYLTGEPLGDEVDPASLLKTS